MGKKKRKKQRHRDKATGPRWACLGCGMAMFPQVGEAGRALARAARPDRPPPVLVHVCGGCKRLHAEAAGGTLRDLTTAERFGLALHCPKMLDLVEELDFQPTDVPTGTILIVEE